MKRALELDPNFAVAYVGLGVSYGNLGQASLSAENIKKAYALRDRVSEHEKYRISAFYYDEVTGEFRARGFKTTNCGPRAIRRIWFLTSTWGPIIVSLGSTKRLWLKPKRRCDWNRTM